MSKLQPTASKAREYPAIIHTEAVGAATGQSFAGTAAPVSGSAWV